MESWFSITLNEEILVKKLLILIHLSLNNQGNLGNFCNIIIPLFMFKHGDKFIVLSAAFGYPRSPFGFCLH